MSKLPQIHDYQIHLPPLGEGAFGTVYRATYRGISERALKVFKPDTVDLSTMARELEKLSSVAEHHGIVTLHDFELLGPQPHYAMGLHADQGEDGKWHGRTLEHLCGQADAREGWRLLREVAEAVAYLHRNHIIHCDLKPSNILLTDESPQRVKICDFGQSRGDRFDIDTATGTPLYASPDQLRNPSDSADGKGFRWDVYSFGVIAYKLITGELPRLQAIAEAGEDASADAEATIVDSRLDATIEDSTGLDSLRLAEQIEAEPALHWPPWLRMATEHRELIERCLSLDPGDRYADMREVYSTMKQIDQQGRARRSSRLNAVFAVLLVVAIWASGFALVQARRAKAATDEAMKSRDQARDLVLLVADKLSRELSETGQTELISYISENTEPFLENLSDDKRASRTLLQFSARTAAINGKRAEDAGDYPLAMEDYQRAYEIHSQLAEGRPDDLRMRHEAAADLMQVGRMALRLEDYETAIENFEKAFGIHAAEIPAGEAPSAEELRFLALSLEAIATTARAAGSPEQAAETLQRSITLHRNTLAAPETLESPARLPIAEQLVRLELDLGQLFLVEEKLDEAETAFSDAFKQVSPDLSDEATAIEIVITDPLLVADSHRGLASVQLALDRPEAALALFNEELKIRRRETDRRPLEPEPRIALARAYISVADCFDIEEPRTRDLALTSLERAVAELRRLPTSVLESEEVTAHLQACQSGIAQILELSE